MGSWDGKRKEKYRRRRSGPIVCLPFWLGGCSLRVVSGELSLNVDDLLFPFVFLPATRSDSANLDSFP
jgi:hypothetical protein